MCNGDSTPASRAEDEQILGVTFFNGTAAEAFDRLNSTGGLMVVPASPALIKLRHDQDYRRALLQADVVLADSGFLVFLWKMATGRRLRKNSGLSYLKCVIKRGGISDGSASALWVVSTDVAKAKAIEWLREQAILVHSDDCQVAKSRGASDQEHAILLEIEKRRPRHVVIAVGTGGGEKLGLYLREYLLYRPNIHCVGAALGFLTGAEHPIPEWAERHYFGWVFRLLARPQMFLPRLGIALALVQMVFKYRTELPPLKERWTDL